MMASERAPDLAAIERALDAAEHAQPRRGDRVSPESVYRE